MDSDFYNDPINWDLLSHSTVNVGNNEAIEVFLDEMGVTNTGTNN